MDELAMFEELRPDEPVLAADRRDLLRAEIFGEAPARAVVTPLARPGRGPTRGRPAPAPRVRRRTIAVAVAALVTVALGGTWALLTRPAPATPALSPPSTAATDPAPTPVPQRVRIDAPGWRLTRAADLPHDVPALVLFDVAQHAGGPSIRFDRAIDGMGMSLSNTVLQVQVGDVAGTLSTAGEQSLLEWTDGAGIRWFAGGWRVDEQRLVAAASALKVGADGTAVIADPPTGLVVAAPDVAAAYGMYSEYEFARDDGASLQISFSAGGAAANAMRSSDDPSERSMTTLGNEPVSLETYSGGDEGRFRANLQRGFWAWELDGEPFADHDDFLNTVASVHVIDEATWATTLPNDIVAGGAARQAAVDQLLAGVPLPAGFDPAAQDGTADRFTLILQTSAAVACVWIEQWFDATDRGDTAAAADAAAALATSHQWPMLLDVAGLADQATWAEQVWQWADAINGGPGIDTGEGPTPPTRQLAHDGLGCATR